MGQIPHMENKSNAKQMMIKISHELKVRAHQNRVTRSKIMQFSNEMAFF